MDTYTSHDDPNPIYVYRHEGGITLNPRQWLLDGKKELRKFGDPIEVCQLLGFANESDLEENGYYTISKQELDKEDAENKK